MTDRFTLIAAHALTALSLVAASLPAHAEDALRATQMVQTSDLDLHTAGGAASLHHRVRVAARQVCGGPVQFGSAESASFNACVETAEQQAMKTSEAMIASVRTDTRLALAVPHN